MSEDELTDKELYGSDIKLVQIAPGKFDFDLDSNGDFVEVEGKDYMKQRIEGILLTKCRFYPPQLPELINNNEILKQNIDDNGNHFFPGDLEELGYPDYGSDVQRLLNENDSPQLKILMTLMISKAISYEYEYGVDKIYEPFIEEIEKGIYAIHLVVQLVNNERINFNLTMAG